MKKALTRLWYLYINIGNGYITLLFDIKVYQEEKLSNIDILVQEVLLVLRLPTIIDDHSQHLNIM